MLVDEVHNQILFCNFVILRMFGFIHPKLTVLNQQNPVLQPAWSE